MKRDSVFIGHIIHEISYLEEKCNGKTLDDLSSDEDLQHIVSQNMSSIILDHQKSQKIRIYLVPTQSRKVLHFPPGFITISSLQMSVIHPTS